MGRVLFSKSYRLDDDVASDLEIRWIVPSSHKIWTASELYTDHDIDTIIFMVSLTSFMEMDAIKHNDNEFVNSLKIFKRYCHDQRFNKTKFILLFNKTDILKKKISE